MAQKRIDFVINTKVDKSAFIEMKKELQSLQAMSAQDLVKIGQAKNLDEAKTKLNSLQQSAAKLESALNSAFSPKLGTVSLTKFENELKKLDLKKLSTDLNNAGAAGQAAFNRMTASILTTKTQLKESHKILEEFGQTMINTVKWGLTSSMWNTMTGSFQKAYGYVKNLDSSLNNIRIVAKQSADEMDRFAVKANLAAKNLGTSTLDYTNAALIYYQQGGLTEQQIADRTATTIKMANVTGDSAEQVSSYMTSIWNNFDDGSKSLEYYADVMTALGAATASSTDEIADGLEKFAAIADTVGLSYEYATSALATVTAQTRQSADVVGTAFKTLFARIQDLELGETLEDGVTLGKYSEALEKVGISVITAKGEMRDMDDILNDMGDKWDKLTKAQQVSLAQTVAGTRQYTQLVALMDNWNVFQENLNTATNATGELNAQQDIYLESTKAHLNDLATSAERLYKNILDTKGLNDLVDMFSGLVSGAANYIEAIGGSKALFRQLGATALNAFGKPLAKEISTIVTNLNITKEKAKETSAQFRLMQMFKGVKINNDSYNQLLNMIEGLDKYKDALTDVQREEVNQTIVLRNTLAEERDLWNERRLLAEKYYELFTDEKIDLTKHFETQQADDYINNLEASLGDYQEKIGQIQKNLTSDINKNEDKDTFDAYAMQAEKMLENKLVRDQKLVENLVLTLAKYKHATKGLDGGLTIDEFSPEQKEALLSFGAAYTKAADAMIKDAKRVSATIKESANGAGKAYENNVENADKTWTDLMSNMKTQYIVTQFENIASSAMQIGVAISSISSLGDIWGNDSLTTGEKLLQTIMAIANVGQGLASTYKLIHTTADLIRVSQAKNVVGEVAYGTAMKKTTEAQIKRADAIGQVKKQISDETDAIKNSTTKINEKADAIKLEQIVSSDASDNEIKDETAFAATVVASTEAIYEKNKALGEGKISADDPQMMQIIRELSEQQAAKENIQNFLEKSGYKGKYSQIPTMNEDNLRRFVEQDQAHKLARTFKGISGQGHAIARGEMDDFNIENKKGVSELVQFLNSLDIIQKETPSTDKKVKNTKKNAKEAKEALDSIGNTNNNKKTLKDDLSTIGTFLKSIPPQAYIAAAAIAAIGAAIYIAYQKSIEDEKQVQHLEAAYSNLKQELEETKQKTEELKTAFENYEDIKDTLSGCIKGTQAWEEAFEQLNQSVAGLLSAYPELAKIEDILVRDDLTGALVLDQEKLDNFVEQYQTLLTTQEQASLMMQGSISKAKNTVKLNDIMPDIQYAWLEAGLADYNQVMGQWQDRDGKDIPESDRKKWGRADRLDDMAYDKDPITKENYKELANLTTKEFEEKVREMALKIDEEDGYRDLSNASMEEYIEAMKSYQKDIDDLANSTQEATNQIHNAAKLIASTIVGENAGFTENRYATALYEKTYTSERDAIEKRLEGTGINAASGKKNTIYSETLEELKKAGYNFSADSNAVRGSDKKRSLAFRDANGQEVVYSSEQIAEMLAAYRANKKVSETDTTKESAKINSKIAKAAKIDNDLADKVLGEDFDVNDLSLEEYNKLKDIDWEKVGKSLSKDDAKALGKKTVNELTSAIDAEINSYDATKSAENLIKKFQDALESTANGLEVNIDGFEAYTDQLIKNSKALAENDMFAISAAKAHYDLTEHLTELSEAIEDNEKLLRKWASGAEVTTDEAELIGTAITALEKSLGQEVSDNFVKQNLEQILKLAKGDMTVLDDLQKKMSEEYILKQLKVENLESLPEEVRNIINIINAMELEDLEVGTTLNQTALANTLQEMLIKFKMTEEQANNILSNIGFDPDVKMVEATWTDGNGSSATLEYTDPVSGEVKKITNYATTETKGSVKIPIINGKTTRFEGLNDANFKYPPPKTPGSGSKSKPKKEDRLEDEKDRYHDVNVELAEINNALEKIQDKTEQLVGQSKIDNLREQYALLNKEIATTGEKIKIAKGEMAELQGKLSAKGIAFSADGSISNYAAAYDAQLAHVNRIIDHYNSLSAEGQESYQQTLDDAKEGFTKFVEDISRYDEVLTDLIPGLEADIQDAINEQIEMKIEAFHQEIEIRLDMAEAEREWNEFYKKVVKDIEDDDILGNAEERLKDFMSYYKENAEGVIQVNTDHINDILAELKAMDENQTASIYGKDSTEYRKQALEDLQTYYQQLMSDLTDIHDLSDEIHESYVAMIDEAQEKFDEQIATFTQLNELLEHDKNVISMVYGEESYSSLAQYYDKQEENNNKQLDFQKQQVEFWKQQMEIAEEGSDAWEAAKENWISAVDEWNSAVESAIQNLQDKYLNAINAIFQNLNNQVTNGLGLDYTESQWELINRNADQYLDSVNSIYQVQQLQNKYLDAIEKTDNTAQQKRLNDLMKQETDYLREQDKLSQYDLDRANLKYEIALKQMALEEAQQNKNMLRLRRDSQGNYTYQYTADEDQVSSIQQEIADLYNQLYNLDAEEYRGNLEEIYDVWLEFQERMAEAAQINDPEQRAAKELLIKEQYGELINTLVEKNENAQANLYQSTMSHLFDLYNQNIINYDEMSQEQRDILDQFMSTETDLSNAAFDNLFNLYNVNIESFKTMTDEQKDILMGSLVPQWDTAVQMMVDNIAGAGGFLPTCQEAFEEIDAATQDYMSGLEELQEKANVSFEDVKNGIDETIIETEKLLEDNNELISSYEQEIEAIRGVIAELEELISKYQAASDAAKKATEDAYNYWLAEQDKNATIDATLPDPNEGASTTTNETSQPAAPIETPKPSLNVGSYVNVKAGSRWYRTSYGGGDGPARSGSIVLTNPGSNYPYNIDWLGWVSKSAIQGYDTGGYTGDWGSKDGRLAMLHQKELVLNASDTQNVLNAVEILRNITSNLGNTLFSKMAAISAGGASAIANGVAAEGIEQNVHIDAQFPNVTNSHEIEDALNNLMNRASQFIQQSR